MGFAQTTLWISDSLSTGGFARCGTSTALLLLASRFFLKKSKTFKIGKQDFFGPIWTFRVLFLCFLFT
jgi:hypothetical protein